MGNTLSLLARRLLFSHGTFLIGRSAFDIFMNIFIWRLTGDLQTIAIFNIIYVLTHTSMFVFFAGSLANGKTHQIRKTGLIGFSLVYLALFILQSNVTVYLHWFALFIGIFNGLYWLPYHLQRFDMTRIKNRANYTGEERSVKTFVKLVTPIAGGYIISSSHFFSGYATLFLMGTFFYIISFFAGQVEFQAKRKVNLPNVKWYRTMKLIFRYPKVIKVFIADMLNGFSLNGSLIHVVLPLLILEKTGGEFELGGWLSAFALVTIIGSLFIGKKINYRYFDWIVILGTVIFLGSFGLVFWQPSLTSFIIFGAVQGLAAIMITIPRRVYSENLLHKLPNYRANRIGYLVSREIFNVGLGMTASYVLLLLATDFSLNQLTLYAGIIALAVVVQVVMLSTVKYSKLDFAVEITEEDDEV